MKRAYKDVLIFGTISFEGIFCKANSKLSQISHYLTAVFFETGAMLTPTKSRNGTNCGSGGSFQSYLTHS